MGYFIKIVIQLSGEGEGKGEGLTPLSAGLLSFCVEIIAEMEKFI
jgi:hypothetical protein